MHLVYEDTKEEILAVERKAKHQPPHLHQTMELVYVMKGSLELGVGLELFHMEEGDIGLIFPDVIHHCQVFSEQYSEAIQAQQDGADYLGVGAMFPTGTKTDADSVSMEELQKIRAAVSLPIVVIGGINKGNAGRFKPMGIDGLAVVSAIIAQSDIKAAAAELKDLFCGKEKKNGF